MILQGNQRGGARDLALHLLKEENDHVNVHELRGFVSDNLVSALGEAHAISRGTKAKQFLYSLSLNPPANENVATQDFEAAISRVEDKLGLSSQPRAIVFHEKAGADGKPRRHCHAVWSRIDAKTMKAIPLPYTKYKLRELSRELYLEHGWQMPRGFLDSRERDPKSFTHAQWQQAKRNGKDPRAIKAALQDSWATSDSQKGFQQALKDRGFTLAKGDRRGFVALDHACQVYAVPKWTGVRAKDVRVRLKDQDTLPTAKDARAQIAKDMSERLTELRGHQEKVVGHRLSQIAEKRSRLIEKQVKEREQLKAEQERRQAEETKQRQAQFNKGLRGLFDRMLGRHKKLKLQNEREAMRAQQRDQKERDTMVFKQLEARRVLQARTHRLEKFREERQQALSQDIEQYNEIGKNKRELFELRQRKKNRSQDRGPELEL
jgi:hypothetical protein